MNINSLKTEAHTKGGRTSVNVASMKGHSLSTVLLAHLSNADGSELYKVFMSLQVHSSLAQQP